MDNEKLNHSEKETENSTENGAETAQTGAEASKAAESAAEQQADSAENGTAGEIPSGNEAELTNGVASVDRMGTESNRMFGMPGAAAPAKKTNIKVIAAAAAAAAVILIAVIAIIAVSSRFVNIEDYVADSITFSGYDGYGEVDTSLSDLIDFDRLYTDMGFNDMSLSDDFLTMLEAELVLEDSVDISTDNGDSENLKNGDIVTYTFTVDYDTINALDGRKKKLKGKETFTREYEVTGLGEVTELNPFEAVEQVVVSGSSGDYDVILEFGSQIGDYEINYTYNDGYSFEADDKTIRVTFTTPEIANISAGDTITISLETEADEYASSGIVFTTESQDFSVLTTASVTSASQITEACYETVKALFEEAASNANDGEYTFVDMYFWSYTGNYTGSVVKRLVGIYKYTSSAVGSTEQYIYLYINSPVMLSNGELSLSATVDSVTIEKDISFSVFSADETYTSASALLAALEEGPSGCTVTAFDKISF